MRGIRPKITDHMNAFYSKDVDVHVHVHDLTDHLLNLSAIRSYMYMVYDLCS